MRKEAEQMANCPVCNSETVYSEVTSLHITYKGLDTYLQGLGLFSCTGCGEEFYSRSAERKIAQAQADLQRKQMGFLAGREIKGLRERHGLTQEALSRLLGMSPKTVARYESGRVVQNVSTDRLLRLLIERPENIHLLSKYSGVPVREATGDRFLEQWSKYSPTVVVKVVSNAGITSRIGGIQYAGRIDEACSSAA